MKDKSSYSSPNKSQISEGLQNFINAMVEEIVLKGEPFDEQKKKWLKKYSEAEGVNYSELEANLNDFFEAMQDYQRTKANSIIKLLEIQANTCFIDKLFLTKLLSQQSKIILPEEKKIIVPDTQFKTVKIGNQHWMKHNLNVDHFRNGDPIPHAKTDKEWGKAGENKQPAWCYYDNDSENGKKYGKLYNWFAVNDPRGLAPQGYHIPTDEEWEELVSYVGGKDVAGIKLKSQSRWKDNGNGTDEFGFTALPGGSRYFNGYFYDVGYNGCWWSATENNTSNAWYRYMNYDYSYFYRNYLNKELGFSVRCLRD
jgi:uncharacterized protein (TIGR02145 family)